MKKKIRFCLVYRDMWQSSGKYQPRLDQLQAVAPQIIEMGCFDRVETNGGAFEQVQLMYGQNPNAAVREWIRPFNQAGIQTQMLERALNGIRMYPVPADVRNLMFRVKKAQGVDISRSFCGLNDHRNLELSIRYAKQAGMISQAALSITFSPVHTVDYYMDVVKKMVKYGADEICLKDMAGIGRPVMLGELVRKIKKKHSHIKVQYHGHSGPGLSMASMLEVARAGADYIDVAMEPLSWGMVHPDLLSVHALMKDAGFEVPDIDMNAYMKVRSLTQEFIDDFLGYFIDPRNKQLSSLLIGSGLPGGMMGSLMADLKGAHRSINASLKSRGQAELSEDELLVKMFSEVEHIWPKLGYPPLVTPFSQYVKNMAIMNILQMAGGKERYTMIDNNTWDMILGKAGKLPGPLDPEIIRLAQAQGKEFYSGVPQDGYPDELDKFRKEMRDNNWDFGPDDEELFELAMHDKQYRDYRSGVAKSRFDAELAKAKELANPVVVVPQPVPAPEPAKEKPAEIKQPPKVLDPDVREIVAPARGQVIYNLFGEDTEFSTPGEHISIGDRLCYIQTSAYIGEITSPCNGVVSEIIVRQGVQVKKGEVLFRIREIKTELKAKKPGRKKQGSEAVVLAQNPDD